MMKKFKPGITPIILCILLFVSMVQPAAAASVYAPNTDIPQPQPGQFIPGECVLNIPQTAETQVTCGFLSVPERHENPIGPQIKLAVMVIKSQALDPLPDPLFIAQGGPGGSTIDTYAEVFLSGKKIARNRDLVLFDQRGTLYSQPSLICSEYDQLLLDTIELDLSDDEIKRMDLEAAGKCRQRLANEGVDLGAYNSLQNAADIQALRMALGYDQINLYGVSYGTLLALHTLRFYPQGLRSVILDAVVSPKINFIIEAARTGQQALDKLFQTCREDKECSRAYPNTESDFYTLVDQLNQSPQRVAVTDPDSGKTYQMVLDGDTFLSGVFQLLYVGDLIPALPHIIDDAKNGEYGLFSRIFAIFIFDRSTSYGMYYSVLCAEDADYDPATVDLSGVSPQMAQIEKDSPQQFLDVCNLWQVTALAAPMDDPVTSDIPVLVLSGGFDPITPPQNGAQVAQTLKNSFVFEFPTGAHGAALDGACQDGIIQAFLDDPSQAPDATCITPAQDLEFFTPRTVIEIPAIIEMLNLQNGRGIEFLLILAAVVFLSFFIVSVPLNALRLFLRQRRAGLQNPGITQSQNSHAYAPWLIWSLGMIAGLFFASLAAIIVLMVVNNDSRLYYGIPGATRFLFVLPLFFCLNTALLGWLWFRMWGRSPANLWTRSGYALVLTAAGMLIVLLYRWQLLLALF